MKHLWPRIRLAATLLAGMFALTFCAPADASAAETASKDSVSAVQADTSSAPKTKTQTTKKKKKKKKLSKAEKAAADRKKAKNKAKKKLRKEQVPVSVTVDGTTYYFNTEAHLRATKKGDAYYYYDGGKMTDADKKDFTTRLAAEKIVAENTKPSMSVSEKMRICFTWVMKKNYQIHRSFSHTDYWPSSYAMDHFDNKGGDCRSDGAAFAYLAAACGAKNVYVCLDSSGTTNHGWAEVDGKVYDPLFAQSKSFVRNYGVSYQTYRLHAIVKVPVPYASAKSRDDAKKRWVNQYTLSGKKKPPVKEPEKEPEPKKPAKKNWQVGGWDADHTHLLYKDGREVHATTLYKGKLYTFTKSGAYSENKTKKLRAAAKKNQPVDDFVRLAGKPQKREYSDSCIADGKDGILSWRTFKISTFKPADGSEELIMSIEKK